MTASLDHFGTYMSARLQSMFKHLRVQRPPELTHIICVTHIIYVTYMSEKPTKCFSVIPFMVHILVQCLNGNDHENLKSVALIYESMLKPVALIYM